MNVPQCVLDRLSSKSKWTKETTISNYETYYYFPNKFSPFITILIKKDSPNNHHCYYMSFYSMITSNSLEEVKSEIINTTKKYLNSLLEKLK